MATRGKFIVIEGGDGTGKGECVRYLREKLPPESTHFTREPGGTEVGEEIRATLIKHRTAKVAPLTELLLFVAGRHQHVDELIRPTLARGVNVISERFIPSSFAYQIRANEREDLHHLFLTLHEAAVGETQPDLYILLDLDPVIGRARVKGRAAADRFEINELAYHQRVRAGTHEYISGFHHALIDASQPLAQVKEDVWQAVSKLLNHA